MDKTLRKNILLGFFVLVGIILFIVGIFQIGSKNGMFERSFPISTKFNNATGLKVGSNVRYNGVRVGIVKAVTLINDSLVQVDMLIEEKKRSYIYTNAIASIGSDGLMGDKLVNITGGGNGGEPVKNLDMIAARNPINTDHVMETLSQSNDNIKAITENLKTLTSDIDTKNGAMQMLYKDTTIATSLKRSFHNLDAITGKVLDVSATLQRITTQIQNGNGALGEVISDTTMAQSLAKTMSQLKETSDQLIIASSNLSLTMQRANSGKGAVNMMLTDTAFSKNIQQSMINIKNASQGLNENMEALKHNFLTRGYFRRQERKNKNKQDTTAKQ